MAKITWEQTEVLTELLAKFLTKMNFQPGKFHLANPPDTDEITIVVYVKDEVEK